MKKYLPIGIMVAVACVILAQGPMPQQRPMQKMPMPSTALLAALPAQTITITVNLTSDQATAVEKHRRDTYTVVTDQVTGTTTLQPVNATLGAQIAQYAITQYLQQVVQKYPGAAMQQAQTALQAAQKAMQDAQKAAGAIKQ